MSEATLNNLSCGNAHQDEPAEPGEMDPLEVLELSQDVEGADISEVGEKKGKDLEVTLGPPAAASPNDHVQWAVGDQCWAVWSVDGVVYRGMVVALDGDYCRVRFLEYDNQEVMKLSSLRRKPQEDTVVKLETHAYECEEWKAGSPCRAVFSEDGLVYPAVVMWVDGQRCRVRFDVYNNEEEVDVGSLLKPGELHGSSRADKGSSLRSADWRRRRREENQSERGEGGERSSPVRAKVDKDKTKKASPAEKPTNRSSPVFPPFPGLAHMTSGEPLTFTPPPPFDGKDPGGDTVSSMMMMWYMCGFHTGSFMAEQRYKSRCSD